MRTLPTLLCFLFIGFTFTSQAQQDLTKDFRHLSGIVKPAEKITASAALPWFRAQFDLPNESTFETTNSFTDALGMEHRSLRQIHQQIPVEGVVLKMHLFGEEVKSVNGNFISNFPKEFKPQSNPIKAFQKQLEQLGYDSYRWEIPEWEQAIQTETNSVDATWKPQGELVWLARKAEEEDAFLVELCWKYEVYTHFPYDHFEMYLSAKTGDFAFKNPLLFDADSVGTAHTAYSGVQSISAHFDNTQSIFSLQESSRGNGIQTLNANHSNAPTSGDLFVDNDNIWQNMAPATDQYALDCHYATEVFYDYLWNVHGRNGIDNDGFFMTNFVHLGNNLHNAYFDGTSAYFGDGDFSSTPLTTIDIVGHEWTHGLIQQTADLFYFSEPGALNESYADIFGTLSEYYARPTSYDWLLGGEIGTPFRAMHDPNSFGDPDTYRGNYWNFGPSDNYGVHTNSSVHNYYFYLLAEGGTGINDNGLAYNCTGLGMEKAAAISYRTLTVYLTPFSDFEDAYLYSLQAAEDLYGHCSPEVLSVNDAWSAVGFGGPVSGTVTADFSAKIARHCGAPAYVEFRNTSTQSGTGYWDMGDGTTFYNNDDLVYHTYNNFGEYTVRLIHNSICSSDTMVRVKYITVVEAPEDEVICNIYPNPASDIIYFDFTRFGSPKKFNYDIVDASGKIIHKAHFTSDFSNPLAVDVSDLPTGMYVMHFYNSFESYSVTFFTL